MVWPALSVCIRFVQLQHKQYQQLLFSVGALHAVAECHLKQNPFSGCLCAVCRERDAAAMAAQQALASQLQHHLPHAYVAHVSHMTVVLDDLLTAARAAVNKQAGTAAISTLTAGSRASRSSGGQLGLPSFGSGLSSDVSWVFGAMMKLKELLLESDRCAMRIACQGTYGLGHSRLGYIIASATIAQLCHESQSHSLELDVSPANLNRVAMSSPYLPQQ